MRPLAFLPLVLILAGSACSSSPSSEDADRPASRPDLFLCDGCEAASDASPDTLDWRVAVAGADEPGDRLILTGRVFQPDGETPASGVVLYLHQADAEGLYSQTPGATGWARRHGHLHGWLATDSDGRYAIETIRPASYPDTRLPAHIHVYVQELDRRPYYLDDFVFEDDPFVDAAYRDAQELRGGSGILALSQDPDGTWRGQRDLVLEW